MAMSDKRPKCKLCKERHWLREPCYSAVRGVSEGASLGQEPVGPDLVTNVTVPVTNVTRRGFGTGAGKLLSPPREGDKIQARRRINTLIEMSRLPAPSTLHCIACGESAVQYHHYLGYGVEHHEDVQPLCRNCHVEREATTNVTRGFGTGTGRKRQYRTNAARQQAYRERQQ